MHLNFVTVHGATLEYPLLQYESICAKFVSIHVHLCQLCVHIVSIWVNFLPSALHLGQLLTFVKQTLCISLHKELCIDLAKVRAALQGRLQDPTLQVWLPRLGSLSFCWMLQGGAQDADSRQGHHFPLGSAPRGERGLGVPGLSVLCACLGWAGCRPSGG